MGIPFGEKLHEGAVYRLKTAPLHSVDFPYLIVSENLDEPADILTIKDFRKVRKELKKKLKRGTGLEITINPVRKMDGVCVGRWFSNLSELFQVVQHRNTK